MLLSIALGAVPELISKAVSKFFDSRPIVIASMNKFDKFMIVPYKQKEEELTAETKVSQILKIIIIL